MLPSCLKHYKNQHDWSYKQKGAMRKEIHLAETIKKKQGSAGKNRTRMTWQQCKKRKFIQWIAHRIA